MLKEQIQKDLNEAQLKRDTLKVSVLRMLLSEIKYAEIGSKDGVTEDQVIAVVQREIKKRRESAEAFRQGGREESAQKEEAEALLLFAYLPEQLSDEELEKIVEEEITQTGATTVGDMGKVMAAVMSRASGRAEGSKVSTLVKNKLS